METAQAHTQTPSLPPLEILKARTKMHILTRQFEGVGFLKFHEGEIPFDCWNRILFAAYSGGVNGYVINRLAGESEKQT